MRAVAMAILTPIISGLLLALFAMYIDIQELKAVEPIRIRQLDRIERVIDSIHSLLINDKSANISKEKR